MKLLIVLSIFITLVTSCKDNAYRCVGNEGVSKDKEHTYACRDKLELGDCWCYHMAEYYANPFGQKEIQDFKDCCLNYEGYSWRVC